MRSCRVTACDYQELIKNSEENLKYFGLDRAKVGMKQARGLTCDAEEAALYLSAAIGKKLSAKNVLELCVDNSFGAYLDEGEYLVKASVIEKTPYEFPKSRHLIQHHELYVNELNLALFRKKIRDEIKNRIQRGDIDINYTYPIQGLLRLKKKSAEFPDLTVIAIRDNKNINLAHGENQRTILQLEPSLEEYILGVSPYLHIGHIKEKIKIFVSLLLFRCEELQAFSDDYNTKHRALKLIQNRNDRVKVNKENGRNSGKIRKENSDRKWQHEKQSILELAKEYKDDKKSANYIAECAVKKKLTFRSSSSVAKKIRDDSDFKRYIQCK